MFEQYFGHRLRELRLAQGLTKEKFCGSLSNSVDEEF